MLQRAAWTVAALVMLINAYLLLDFVISEVTGLLFGFLVSAGTTAYVSFIIYLLTHCGALPSDWLKVLSKRFAYIRN